MSTLEDGVPLDSPAEIGWSPPGPKSFVKLQPGQVLSVATPGFGDPSLSTDFTVLVVLTLPPSASGILFQRVQRSADDPFGFLLAINPDNTFRIRVTEANGDRRFGDIASRNLADGAPHLFALVREGGNYRTHVDEETHMLGPAADDGWRPEALPAGTLSLGGKGPTAPSPSIAGGLSGGLYGAGLWSRALTVSELPSVSVGDLNGHLVGLEAYWSFDRSLRSLADVNGRYTLSSTTPVDYRPAFRTLYTGSQLPSQFVQIDAVANPDVAPETIVTATLVAYIPIEVGCLCATLTGRGLQLAPPTGVTVAITAPDGNTFPAQVDSAQQFVKRTGDGITALVQMRPSPREWLINISARADQEFVFHLHILPTENAVAAMATRLADVFAGPDNEVATRKRFLDGQDMPLRERVAVTAIAAIALAAAAVAGAPLAVLGLLALVGIARAETFLQGSASHRKTVDFVFDNHGQTQRKHLLFLDAGTVGDQGAHLVFARRRKFLYEPIVAALAPTSWVVHKLFERDDNPMRVREHLSNPKVVYVSASGHGSVDALFGWGVDNIVLQRTGLTPELAAGKIFHILACRCGSMLVPKLVELGAKAAIGYDEPYGLGSTTPGSPLADLTVQAAIVVDRVLLSGGTVQEAVDQAKDQYRASITKLENQLDSSQFVIDWLRRNRGYLVFSGDGSARL